MGYMDQLFLRALEGQSLALRQNCFSRRMQGCQKVSEDVVKKTTLWLSTKKLSKSSAMPGGCLT